MRLDRLNVKIEDLKVLNNMWKGNYETSARQLARVLAERDSARTQLQISEKTSAQRLLLIQREVPKFSRAVRTGTFDYYRANL